MICGSVMIGPNCTQGSQEDPKVSFAKGQGEWLSHPSPVGMVVWYVKCSIGVCFVNGWNMCYGCAVEFVNASIWHY